MEDEALKNQLKTVENQLRASNQQQQEARDQAIRASLNLGAFLCTKMLDDGQYLDFLQKNYASNCKAGEEDPTCGVRKVKLEEQQERLHKLSRYYASSLVESGSLYGKDLLEARFQCWTARSKPTRTSRTCRPTCVPTGPTRCRSSRHRRLMPTHG